MPSPPRRSAGSTRTTRDKENFCWALFTYDQCGTACTDRTDPIRDAIVEATGVEPFEAEAVDETSGLEAAETFLQQNPDLAMVIGINDAGALGAYQAIQTAITNGRDPGTIFVAGMDGQTEALELIAEGGGENGIYRACGALILDDLGRAVADLPADLLEGEDVSVLELPVRDDDAGRPGRAQEIVDTYNSFTGGRPGRATGDTARHVIDRRSRNVASDDADAAERPFRGVGIEPEPGQQRLASWFLRHGIVSPSCGVPLLRVPVRALPDDLELRARAHADLAGTVVAAPVSLLLLSGYIDFAVGSTAGWPGSSWASTSTRRGQPGSAS